MSSPRGGRSSLRLLTTVLRGIVAISIRSLAIAAESLLVREEQQEVIGIFDRIERETGWRIGFLSAELKQTWGWPEEQTALQHQQQQRQQQQQQQHAASMVPQPTAAAFQSFPQAPSTSSSGQAGMSVVPPAPAAGPAAATEAAMAAEQRNRLRGIMNPLMATADFSMQQHPYQSYYVAPNPHPSIHASPQVSTSPQHHMLHVGAPSSSEHHRQQQPRQGHPSHHSQHHQS